MQSRCRSHLPLRCRNLGSLPKADQVLERFHQRCLCPILGKKWQDYVSNEEVFKRASLHSMESILLQVQQRWAGHASWTEDIRMPKAVLFDTLQEGKCDRGSARKLYKGRLKRQLAEVGINRQSWQQISDRDSKRPSVRKPSHKFEAERLEAAKKYAEGRQSEQPPNHPQPKPSPV